MREDSLMELKWHSWHRLHDYDNMMNVVAYVQITFILYTFTVYNIE